MGTAKNIPLFQLSGNNTPLMLTKEHEENNKRITSALASNSSDPISIQEEERRKEKKGVLSQMETAKNVPLFPHIENNALLHSIEQNVENNKQTTPPLAPTTPLVPTISSSDVISRENGEERKEKEIVLTPIQKNTRKRESCNPIILMQRIYLIILNSFKDLYDTQKQIVSLKKGEWEHYSDTQSKNYRDGESLRASFVSWKVVKGGADLLASFANDSGYGFNPNNAWFPENITNYMNTHGGSLINKQVFTLVGTFAQGWSDTLFPNQEIKNKIAESITSYQIGSTSTEYQTQVQEKSSIEQTLHKVADECTHASRLAVQTLIGQAV